MAYEPGSEPGDAVPPMAELKIVVAGGFAVGKTTMVAAVSETEPLMTEEFLTAAGQDIDDLTGVGDKTTTTVAMDFGRITFDTMILFLFGMPGQERFWFTWPDLSDGAVGAVVLADTRRLETSFAATTYFERRGTPFVVAVNEFDSAKHLYTPVEVRQALGLDPEVPVLTCDVRDRRSAMTILVRLVEHSLRHRRHLTSGAHA